MIFILFRSSFHVSLTVHVSIVYSPITVVSITQNSMLFSHCVISHMTMVAHTNITVLTKTSPDLLFNSLTYRLFIQY